MEVTRKLVGLTRLLAQLAINRFALLSVQILPALSGGTPKQKKKIGRADKIARPARNQQICPFVISNLASPKRWHTEAEKENWSG
jgi:hypothetical protein